MYKLPVNIDVIDLLFIRQGVKGRVEQALNNDSVAEISELKCWSVVSGSEKSDSNKEVKVIAHFWEEQHRPPYGSGKHGYKTAVFRAEEGWPFGPITAAPLSPQELRAVCMMADCPEY